MLRRQTDGGAILYGSRLTGGRTMTITARHALVTGGSRGIGRGITLKLADHGVHVAINYLKDEASAKATLEQVRARGADGFIVQADVSAPEQMERLFARVRDEFGS